MQFKHYLQQHVLAVCLLIWPLGAAAADSAGAVAIIEEFHATLLEVMQNAEKLGFQGRYDKLAPVFESRFDTPLIAQVILSRYWKDLGEDQQQQFIGLFNRLSISTYASRFDSYSNQSFRTVGVKELKRGRLLVKTEFIEPGGDTVKFDYLVHQKQDKWSIISVIANGVNDIALKRAEYATIMKSDGFDRLVGELETKIRELGAPADNI